MKPDLYIFDFDGTLADSAGWFRSILPDIAARFGFRCPGSDELEVLRHKPPREVMRILNIPGWKLVFIAMHVRKRAAREGHFPIFDGIPEVLEAIKTQGARIAVVSSNAEASVRKALGAELSAKVDTFSCGAGMFGKAKHFRDVLKRLGTEPGRALSVGDELRDIEAARIVGLKTAAVGWGFGVMASLQAEAPDYCFETVEAFRTFVGN